MTFSAAPCKQASRSISVVVVHFSEGRQRTRKFVKEIRRVERVKGERWKPAGQRRRSSPSGSAETSEAHPGTGRSRFRFGRKCHHPTRARVAGEWRQIQLFPSDARVQDTIFLKYPLKSKTILKLIVSFNNDFLLQQRTEEKENLKNRLQQAEKDLTSHKEKTANIG